MSEQVSITLDLGTSVEEAEAAAREFANTLYPLAPINDSRGQSFKNAFIKAWFDKSERSERAAKARFDITPFKPVINDEWNSIEEDFTVDGELLNEAIGVTVTRNDDGTIFIVVPPQD